MRPLTRRTTWPLGDAWFPVSLIAIWVACVLVVLWFASSHAFDDLIRSTSTLFAGILAGFGALLAASIAYRGTTSKTRFDREVDARNLEERERNLMLKIDNATRALVEQLEDKIGALSHEHIVSYSEAGDALIRSNRVYCFGIVVPFAFDDAWNQLSL